MKCPRCQRDGPPDAEFCSQCGTKLTRFCIECGSANPPTHRFCTKCGHALAVAAREADAPVAAPKTYTPTHLAEKILTSRVALEGERKQVTVLFADLKGSMDLLAERDPEEARRLLDPVLEHMMEAVHRYEGTVNQVMGDGIMALFGAPLAHEDHAVRACYAALQMQETVRRHAEGVRRREGISIQIRVGLNSGDVVVRSVESDLRMDYSAVGRTTHLAARMEQLATPGSILITGDTLRFVEGYVVVKSLGPISIKGIAEPLEVHELQGVRSGQRSLQARLARGLTRFVGRDVELEQLRRALDQAGSSHGQVVAVVGEPGMGKSRLFYEFTHSPPTREWLVLESGAMAHGRATPYLAVIDLLKAYFQIDANDDRRAIGEKVRRKLMALDEGLVSTLPALLALLDAPVDDPHWQALDPQQRRRRTLDAVKHLVLRESQVQPVLLVIEDLHWIDSETEAVLQSLVERLPTARVLLLVNYRPEHQHGWGTKTYYTQLPIDPLPPEGATDLLSALLGDDVSLQPLKRQLIDRTEGNPFFLEESVRTLVETGVLDGPPGAYRLTNASPTIQVPPTIQAVLAARVDRLPSEEKRLLQCAAVIGKDVPFELLQAIVDVPEEATRRGLTALRAAEFLYETRLFPGVEYTFKHALTHEMAYGSILLDRRRAAHAAIAAAIERLYPDRLAEHAERLAHHAFRGEQWDKAVTYYHQAAARAMSHSAYREAVACLEQALAALHHLPETPDTLERGIDLRSDLRAVLFPLGEFRKLLGYVREAERLGQIAGDQRRLGWVSAFMIPALWITGQRSEALQYGRTAQSLAAALGNVPLQALVHTHVGIVWTTLGDYRQAEDELRTASRLLVGDLVEKPLGRAGFPAVLSRVFLTMGLADRGEFDEGLATGREALRLAEKFDHSWPLNLAWWSLGYVHGIRGEIEDAIRLLERCLMLARDGNVAFFGAMVAWFLGRTYVLAGRRDDGLALLGAGLSDMEAMGLSPYHTVAVVDHGEALALSGQLDEALACGTRAVSLARERGERGHQALALRVLGEIGARRDPPEVDSAEHHYRQAMALAAELGMRPLVAHCQLGLSLLYRRVGRRSEERFAAATTMLREMDMRFWIERAEAELKIVT